MKITNRARAAPQHPSWSPDGEWLTFHACKDLGPDETCALFIVRSDGRDLTQLTGFEFANHFAVWRP